MLLRLQKKKILSQNVWCSLLHHFHVFVQNNFLCNMCTRHVPLIPLFNGIYLWVRTIRSKELWKFIYRILNRKKLSEVLFCPASNTCTWRPFKNKSFVFLRNALYCLMKQDLKIPIYLSFFRYSWFSDRK